jgi:UbiD family decarboxylase
MDELVDEYDMASSLLDAPLDMVKCETSDLMVPADCEIVIEGVVTWAFASRCHPT